MADATLGRELSKSSERFNYTEVKKRYLEQVKMYYSNRKLPVITPYTRDVVDRIKKLIKEKQVLKEAGHPSGHAKYKVANRYQVIEKNGQEILICKRILPTDPIVQILPAEDCFDILVSAHLQTKHGRKEKMLNTIKKCRYMVPKTSIDFLLAVCEVCNLNGKINGRADEKIPPIFHSRGQVCLVDMSKEPDGQFKHILCYVDRFTRFMLLRPLMSESVQETAMELLKIFFDFGPPEKLETYNRPFFMQVMSLINTAHSEFNISLVLPVKMTVLTPLDIQEMIRKWQNETGSHNWAMGCHMVQWKNNSEVNSNTKTPYCAVFKRSVCKTHEKDKSEGHGLNYQNAPSGAPHLMIDDNITSNTSIIIDSDIEENSSVHKENDLTDDDEDCLITITESPNESMPSLAVTTANLSNKQMSKLPNLLRKNTLEEVSYKDTVNVNKPLLVLSPFKNIEVKNDDYTIKDLKHVEDNLSKPNNRCHVCKTEIKKVYICIKCDRNVHLFCSDRLLQPNISPDVLNVTCTSCTLSSRKEKELRKRKHDDIDSDEADETDIIYFKD